MLGVLHKLALSALFLLPFGILASDFATGRTSGGGALAIAVVFLFAILMALQFLCDIWKCRL